MSSNPQNDDKKQYLQKQFEEGQERIREQRAADELRKTEHSSAEAHQAELDQKALAEAAEARRLEEEEKKHFKEEKRKREEEVERMKKEKEKEAERLEARREKRRKERELREEYMKELDAQNKTMMEKQRRETEAEQLGDKLFKEADIEAAQKKQRVDIDIRHKKRDVEKTARKARGDADEVEKRKKMELEEQLGKQRAILANQERKEVNDFKMDIERKKTTLQKSGDARANIQMRQLDAELRSGEGKIRETYRKKTADLEVKGRKDIFAIEQEAKRARDKASLTERETFSQLDRERAHERKQADIDAVHKKEEVKKKKRDIRKGQEEE